MIDPSKPAANPHPMDAPVEPISDDLVTLWVNLIAQGAAMAVIALIGADSWPWGIATWIFVGLGTAVAAAALPSLGRSFRVLATPNSCGLKTGGLYGLVRHPMYLGLILVGFGICLDSRPLAWLFFGFLVMVLLSKISLEERYLASAYPEYATYRTNTKSLIPFLW